MRQNPPSMPLASGAGVSALPRATGRGAITTRTLESAEEIEALRGEWQALGGASLTTDIDYVLTVGRFHPEVLRPHVVVVERDGSPVTIVAGHLQRGWIPHGLGPWIGYRPTMRSVNVSYRGLIGEQSRETVEASIAELRRALDEHAAELIQLRYLEPGGLMHERARATATLGRRQHLVPLRSHWSMSIGGSLEETLSHRAASTREGLRRLRRRIERAWSGALELEVLSEPAFAEHLFATVDEVASRSYQLHGQTLFARSELERELALLGLRRGWYRAYILRLGGRPAAFWTGYSYGGWFGWRGATGYDPAFHSHSPGTYTLFRLIEALSDDPAVTQFDLGGGDTDYKPRFADRRWQEIDVRLLGPGMRLLGINAVGTTFHAVHHGLRGVGAAFGIHTAPTRLLHRRLKAIAREGEPRAPRRRGLATSQTWPVQRVGEVEPGEPPRHLDPR